MSSAVNPGYATKAIWVIDISFSLGLFRFGSGKGFAILVRRDTDTPNEVAPHGLCGTKAATGCNRHDGVVGLLQLSAGGFGPDAFHVLAGRLADLVGEHAGEMAWAHGRAAGQVVDVVRPTRFGLDGFLHL